MRRNSRTFAVLAGVTTIMLLPLPQPGFARATPITYDGAWWVSVSPDQQFGFVGGFLDCYWYEFKGPDSFKGHSIYGFRDLLTHGYQAGRFARDESVSRAMLQLHDTAGEKPAAVGGETRDEPHGYFDGAYWEEADSKGHDRQLGFLAGYLSCHRDLAQNKDATYSKTPNEYRILINKWYGWDQESGRINAAREATKIAYVLFEFRDSIPR